MFLKRLGAGILVLALTSACVSTYRGPGPDYSYVGTAAEAEIQRFTFKEGFLHQGGEFFIMGADQQHYLLNSLKPVIQEVSPEAWRKIETGRVWTRVGQVAFLSALVILISEVSDDDDDFSQEQSLAYWPLIGLSFSSNIVRAIYMDRAARQYNQDLRAKFTPTLGMTFSY
jgi:hypothetical protein